MEIIKHGNIKSKYQNTCPFCGCIYNYAASDIYMIYTGIAVVDCPECGNSNIAATLPSCGQTYNIPLEINTQQEEEKEDNNHWKWWKINM